VCPANGTTSTTVIAGGAHRIVAPGGGRTARRGEGWSDCPPLCQAGGPWLPHHTEVYTRLSIYWSKSFIFLITNEDCAALLYVGISTPPLPMDKVVVACPSAHNNSGTRGRSIYVGVITDPGGGVNHACSSSSSKLMVRFSAVCHHL
jgi:hypothetical protein